MLMLIPLAPFAISIFPILTMLANNAKEVSLSVALRPLAVSMILGLLLLIVFRLVFQHWDKAAQAAVQLDPARKPALLSLPDISYS